MILSPTLDQNNLLITLKLFSAPLTQGVEWPSTDWKIGCSIRDPWSQHVEVSLKILNPGVDITASALPIVSPKSG